MRSLLRSFVLALALIAVALMRPPTPVSARGAVSVSSGVLAHDVHRSVVAVDATGSVRFDSAGIRTAVASDTAATVACPRLSVKSAETSATRPSLARHAIGLQVNAVSARTETVLTVSGSCQNAERQRARDSLTRRSVERSSASSA